jgi:membrane protease YdiL (CAAX protease family)
LSVLTKVSASAVLVIIPLIAGAWLPPGFPTLLRQLLLVVWGVGATFAAERLLFSASSAAAFRALGFAPAHPASLVLALLVSVPMWTFLPLLATSNGVPVALRPDWFWLLIGVVLVNGVTEEVIHRAFVFGHLRHGRSFVTAAAISATIFAGQHLYLIFTIGSTAGLASVLLAALLAFPLAYMFEHGGNSIGAPVILHTSSNAPMMIVALPDAFIATALLPHMGVVLLSLSLVFVLGRFLEAQPRRGRAHTGS